MSEDTVKQSAHGRAGALQIPPDWRARLLYGALGGLTLVVVRAIQLRFFVGEPWRVFAVGWLTLLGFAIISIIWSLVTDEHQRTKVYLSGLAAPSVVAAFLSGSMQFSAPESSRTGTVVPDLSFLGHASVFARAGDGFQAAPTNPQSAEKIDFSVEEIDAADGRITDGLRASIIGQLPPSRSFLFVIGKTKKESRAREVAMKLTRDLGAIFQNMNVETPEVHLLKPVGGDEIFVTIGKLQDTALEAEALRGDVASVFLRGGNDFQETKDYLRNGLVVDATLLGFR